ncbi:glutathione S-transferase family protein [Myxococcus llanfairpwllgwyngyllgogerychwyrndrobwllllantysiliogogogochensis]|uniref:glutathione transferase n=1 Tax=Myxococcus llanfairpwllgwyngyllgogerychwyrndrobwllllantysiliogogogochensis TaxID=2590453 RepID=A0A540WKH7_9BACT|nr:glutathione binding-like protein [Myxococcus llanfairpwllgwyngyllgogerychwyrndrobwllllantysiliogogogochensis]TQF09522.1 glutathione S-transferase family protein [Myxococcus llanfairpwllgwyngyllgogerychwyrndrobwllllantysiliogogogochensis]
MKVYGHPMSICTRKVLTTLLEKGHEAQFVLVDLGKGEQKHPAHLARHPFGVVPAFEDDDGFVLYESRAIIRYLDRKLPGASLTPSQPHAYGLMEQFIGVEQSYFSPAAFKVIWERVFKPHMGGGAADEARVQEGRAGVDKVFGILEPMLAKQPYLAGDSFSLADVSWMPELEFLVAAGEQGLFDKHPSVAAWWKRIGGRPSWKKVAHG